MTKIHWIRDNCKTEHPRRVITHCGKEGWQETITNEFTDGNYIFEADEGLRTVTCKRCLKSAERISNSPWGCTRSPAPGKSSPEPRSHHSTPGEKS